MTTSCDDIWQGQYKIPWHESDFSRRMLAEHLCQAHDMASRRLEWIDRQVVWIHRELLRGRAARTLDLGCGPGLYAHRLGMLGHHCRAIDFGPASIEYARTETPAGADCEFILADLRQADFGGPLDLAIMLFGEFNVFSPSEILDMLRKARANLVPGGRMMLEVSTPLAVRDIGSAEPTEREHQACLFSDRPHRCRTESRWLPEAQVAMQTFTITDTADGATRFYRSTTKAWADDELSALLNAAGFASCLRRDDWPCNTCDLALWIANTK